MSAKSVADLPPGFELVDEQISFDELPEGFELMEQKGSQGFKEEKKFFPSFKERFLEQYNRPKGLRKEDFDIPDFLKALLSGALTGVEEGISLGPLGPPSPSFGIGGGELFKQVFPYEETTNTNILERAGKLAPLAFLNKASIIPKIAGVGLGALGGEAAKNLGAGEIGQSVAETFPQIFTGSPGLVAKKGQQPLIDLAKQMKVTEKELAPALTPKGKGNFLSKFVTKRGRTEKVLNRTRNALGSMYEKLKETSEAQKGLTQEQSSNVFNKLEELSKELPAEVRNKIIEDFNNFKSQPITGKSLITFQSQLNNVIPKYRQAGKLLRPIREAAQEISPEFGNNLNLTNELYGNFASLYTKLKPTIRSDVFEALSKFRKGSTLLYGIYTGNFPLILESVGEQAGKILAREMLLNPRFKNLTGQMIKAVKNNNKVAIQRINQEILKEANKKISNISEQEEKEEEI